MKTIQAGIQAQAKRNQTLLDGARYLGPSITSQVLPFQIDIASTKALTKDQVEAFEALQIDAASTSIQALASLAKIKELDHLGGGLELIPSLLLSLAVSDYKKIEYTIEHAHTSIGYFSALAALGFLESQAVIDTFRRGLDIPGHVSWLPGGTQLNGGRLGVMIPAAVDQALGKRGHYGTGSWVITHCGDAGWISGQALNGFNGADVHGAPISFIMHRNGIQLSGSTKSILDKDPRSLISAMGIELIEIPTLHDTAALYQAYRQAYALAQEGRANMIFPVGYTSTNNDKITVASLGQMYGISDTVDAFAAKHDVALDTEIWIPGSLMSFRDVDAMIECVFLVNDLPGGKGHHDGHMQGRDTTQVISNPMFQKTALQQTALATLQAQPKSNVVTHARPAPGSENLLLDDTTVAAIDLPGAGQTSSPRTGSEAGYAVIAQAHPDKVYITSCDLDASTKLGKARSFLAADHQFEMSIEEQVATLMTNGLALNGASNQLNVVSTFAAFYEGIAREGFDMWRYQRNLNGVNEGLNVAFHLSHVGACTGRDHFSGWGLDWINIGLTYLPYLHRFYAPADARAAFIAVRDLAAHYGGHIIGIPREGDLPILEKDDGSGPLWATTSAWESTTPYRTHENAQIAILAVGAPAYLAAEAASILADEGTPVDVIIINGFPLEEGLLERWTARYSNGLVTLEDGLIGNATSGIKGFASIIAGAAKNIPTAHVGITDPRVAPAEGCFETWEHFGISTTALVEAVNHL